LGLLQKGDEIMADHVFTIEDLLLPLGVKLNILPFLGERPDGSKRGSGNSANCISMHSY